MSDHAILAPSSAGRWVKCAGSVKLSRLYPQDADTQKSKEGTAAHWAASEILNGRQVDVGGIAPNGVMLTDEMIDSAEVYTDDVQAVVARTGAHVSIEQRIDISYIHADNWGTPDAWLFDRTEGIIYVWDFKHGHMYVDEYENWQMTDYVAGIADFLGVDGLSDQHIRVHMTVVQPRCFTADGMVRTWECRLSDMRGYFNALTMAAEKATKDEAPCTPNSHCNFCSARHVCKALQVEAYKAIEVSYDSNPVEMSPEAIGLEATMIDRAMGYLKARQTGLHEQILSINKSGVNVPHYAVKPTESRLTWAKPISEIAAMGDMMGIATRKEASITPRQAIKAGLPEELVMAYAGREEGGMKLVADDGRNANKIFTKGATQ